MVPRAAQRPQEAGQWPPCLWPAQASPSLLSASVPSPVCWDCWRERTFIITDRRVQCPAWRLGCRERRALGISGPGRRTMNRADWQGSGLSCLIPSRGHDSPALSGDTP